MQSFQRRPFILIEVFIAIALLTLCAFPLIGFSLKMYRYQKEQLLMLELERQAELYFYQILKEKISNLDFNKVSAKHVLWTFSKELEILFEGEKQVYYPHYHLYHAPNIKSKTHKNIWCEICFPRKQIGCSKNRYKFAFLAKKVAENSLDPHVKNKEENLKEHERSPKNI